MTEYLPSKIGKKARISILITHKQHSTGNPSLHYKAIKRNKRHPVWKRSNKTVLILDGMVVCKESPKEFTRKAPRSYKTVLQSCKIQDQHMKINFISICKHKQVETKILKCSIIYNCSPQMK